MISLFRLAQTLLILIALTTQLNASIILHYTGKSFTDGAPGSVVGVFEFAEPLEPGIGYDETSLISWSMSGLGINFTNSTPGILFSGFFLIGNTSLPEYWDFQAVSNFDVINTSFFVNGTDYVSDFDLTTLTLTQGSNIDLPGTWSNGAPAVPEPSAILCWAGLGVIFVSLRYLSRSDSHVRC